MSTQPNLPLADLERAQAEAATAAWKHEVNERLAAHRNRKNMTPVSGGQPTRANIAGTRAAEAAARVAARYSQAPTYSEMLAEEARAAAAAAEAAAAAAMHAHAAAQAVLANLEAAAPASMEAASSARWDVAEPHQATFFRQPEPEPEVAPRWLDAEPEPVAIAEPIPEPEPIQWETRWERELPQADLSQATAQRIAEPEPHEQELNFEAATVEPAETIPANLIEFPRELVAPRKARPRLAEGPLRAEADQSQMNIFDVDPGAISLEPVTEPAQAEWHGISLGAHPVAPIVLDDFAASSPNYVPASAMPMLFPASLEDRLMAAMVDSALTIAAFIGVAAGAIALMHTLPTGKVAIGMAAGLFMAIAVAYQVLCFTLSDATPGMRYAKIALCTFADENPTRAETLKRIPATLLALFPAALGLLWAFFDEDHLGWHDRMTHTYQRKY